MKAERTDCPDGFRIAVVSDDAEPLLPLLAFLREQLQIETVHSFDEGQLPADLSGYRGVFTYIHATLQPGTAGRLVHYTQVGGRLIIPHHGIASSKIRNPDWLDFVGIRIAPRDDPNRPWRVIANTTHTFVNLCPGHYITSYDVEYNDVQSFRTSPENPEELVPAMRFADTEVFLNQQHARGGDKTILFGSHCLDPESGQCLSQVGTGWMEPSGKGWIFYLQPGHQAEDFRHPLYRQVILNCLTWTPLEPGSGDPLNT